MAWRIHESVIRGEIDNRDKGVVRGKLWLDGLHEPVVLELAGNGCADLAGCLLRFRNPGPTEPMRRDAVFSSQQRGRIGDLTASRKVRVFDIPTEEALEILRKGGTPPEHMSNGLYLEWFSDANGRVVIESTDFEIEISEPAWRLTEADEAQRVKDTAAGWGDFLGKLDAAVEKHKRGSKDPEEDWDEHDYERFMKECDARTDKYMELMEKYGDSDEAEEKIAEEMGWNREMTPEEAEENARHVEEMNRICEESLKDPLSGPEPNPATEGIDWIRTEDGEIRHPVQHRCFESAVRLWQDCDELDLGKSDDDDLAKFVSEFQIAGAKLAGALDGIAEGNEPHDPSFTVAYLKRALDHLHKAQAGCEAVAAKKLVPEEIVTWARTELFEIRESILNLMQKYRGER